jgi:hypothetical protein
MRDELDGSLVDVSSPLIVLGIDLLESGVLQPDYKSIGDISNSFNRRDSGGLSLTVLSVARTRGADNR